MSANTGHLIELACAMADAISQHRGARGQSMVGKDGRTRYTPRDLVADLAIDAAERRFRAAIGQAYNERPNAMTEIEAIQWLNRFHGGADEPTTLAIPEVSVKPGRDGV